MLRGILVGITALCCCCSSYAQLKKFYAVKNETEFDTINFCLKATSGTCFVKPSYHTDPVTIYGNPDFNDVNPSFNTEIKQSINYVDLTLEDYKKSGLSHTIAYSMFGGHEDKEANFWKVYLNDNKVYKLNLNYGVGSANVDLSGIPV